MIKPYQNLSLEDMPGEIWKDVPGWEGYYQVSNQGRAKSLAREVTARANKPRKLKAHILIQSVVKGRRYLSFMASACNKKERIYLHRCVSLLFHDNPYNKPCVDHINTDTFDNRASNLRWVTYHENSSNPLTKKHTSFAKSGEKCFFYGKVFGNRRILRTSPDGSIKEYNSIKEASRDGFNYRGIQYCLSSSTSNLYKGFTWEYVD